MKIFDSNLHHVTFSWNNHIKSNMKIDKHDILKVEFIENTPIREITTYKTEGSIKGLFLPKTQKELIVAYSFLKENNFPFMVVGNGSNLLISPKSNIFAISTKKLRQNIQLNDNQATFSTSVPLAKAYSFLAKNGLKGFEEIAGIPATIGGAIKNNASAFGRSIFEFLESVKVFDKGQIKNLMKNDIAYSYHSTNLGDKLILSATFKLKNEKPCQITQDFVFYQQLRASRQPKGLSCGSVFRNPFLMSAGKLIEDCGLKGKSVGHAQISTKHANFIINHGDASFNDIKALIELCQNEVSERFDIDLSTEVEIIE